MINLAELASLTSFKPNINRLIHGDVPSVLPYTVSYPYDSYYLPPAITTTISNNTTPNASDKKLNYFLVPGQDFTFNYHYQNIDKDPKLRKQISDFFTEELLEWLKNDSTLSHLNSELKNNSYKKNRELVYKALRKYTHIHNVRWFDLKNNYSHVRKHLISLLSR
jgi:hypothetical protein